MTEPAEAQARLVAEHEALMPFPYLAPAASSCRPLASGDLLDWLAAG